MSVTILVGDVREQLAQLPDGSVHCVVTSPPYWGLRDYGVEGQIGLEPDFRDHIATLVDVFREVRRVLRADGTLWLNLGDSYAPVNRGENARRRRETLSGMQAAHPHADLRLLWEPACGDGRMAKVLDRWHAAVVASDIGDWGYGDKGIDFLDPAAAAWLAGLRAGPIAGIVTNPPFDQAVLFIARALQLTKPTAGKVAILQRHEFDAPAKNHPLFAPPFAAKLVLHKRPRWSDEPETASPRFPYAWYLWDWRHQGEPVLRYLPDPDDGRVKPGQAKAAGRLL